MKTPRFTIGVLWLIATISTTGFSQEDLVVRENQKEGTTNWLLFNYDQVVPGRDEVWKREKGVEGYCSHTSIKAGETLKVFVSTEPAAPFKIDFYRMGYYGGKGGRLMRSTGTLPGKTQPTPEDGPKALIECKWDASYELKIPQDCRVVSISESFRSRRRRRKLTSSSSSGTNARRTFSSNAPT